MNEHLGSNVSIIGPLPHLTLFGRACSSAHLLTYCKDQNIAAGHRSQRPPPRRYLACVTGHNGFGASKRPFWTSGAGANAPYMVILGASPHRRYVSRRSQVTPGAAMF